MIEEEEKRHHRLINRFEMINKLNNFASTTDLIVVIERDYYLINSTDQ